jgi:hypothetical protein
MLGFLVIADVRFVALSGSDNRQWAFQLLREELTCLTHSGSSV